MVLCGYDDARRTGIFYYLAPLVGVESGGIERGGIFFSRAPLLARKGVHTEVDEVIILHFQKFQLAFVGNDGYKTLYFLVVFGIAVVIRSETACESVGIAACQHAADHGDEHNRRNAECDKLFHSSLTLLLFYTYP